MGCSDSGMPPSGWSYHDDQEIKKLKERLDKVTRLLCEACKWIDNTLKDESYEFEGQGFSSELIAWWREHQKADERERDEKIAALLAEVEKLRRGE